MRALVVSNMRPDAAHPERGRFVRDQVAALRGLEGLEVELHEFPPGPRALVGAALGLRRGRRARFDVVHAHFGLSAWPALAVNARVRALTVHGSDIRRPRTRVATAAVLPRIELLAAASAALVHELPGRRARERALVLPCGVDLERFRARSRADARAELGLESDGPFLLFPADPARAEKRHDRARALAQAAGVPLLTLGGVAPERVPLWINAANAVLVPSQREGFGLAVLEALACDVPVLATPVGVHREALAGVAGTLCAPFELAGWRAALEPHLRDPDPRVEGRSGASRFSAHAMAVRVADAWRAALA
ncbi:MAG TPA: glycosyltransferase [Solirubrobacteraceae bacterium]|nr:glycosyltransferase [Solirubrobacteraceae bacterium]